MPDHINSPNQATPRGPWPDWDGVDQLHDVGIGWCVNAAGHPDPTGGYPTQTSMCRPSNAAPPVPIWTVFAPTSKGQHRD